MAKQVFKNYQLCRTLPKLSGNMQIDLIMETSNGSDAFVRQAHLRPMSKYINYAPVVDERIMDRPHHLNIKRFYEKTRSGFYEQAYSPVLKSDWPMLISAAEMPDIKYIKQFDDTYFAGCQRMSYKLYGCTHELLVPVWLDHCYGIRINVYADNTTPNAWMKSETKNRPTKNKLFSVDLSKRYLAQPVDGQKFHNDFTKYLMDYFDYVKITEGSNNVMSIDLKENVSTISGISVESGNYVVRQNLNIAKNLIYRERPLLEANSLITNTFMDYKMITTQLINFNLCFDINDILKKKNLHRGTHERFAIYARVEYIHARKDNPDETYYDDPDFSKRPDDADSGYSWETLPIADFYTNHHFIPKQLVKSEYVDGATDTYNDDVRYPRNVLDYKRDYECTDMIHQNKMSQSICHWYYADQPEDMLFNVYNGFGAYTESGEEYSHGYGSVTDPNDTVYDSTLDNTVWAGTPRINSDQTTMNILNAPYDYLRSGYFKDASGFINGTRFTYDEGTAGYNPDGGKAAPSAVYFATATTPWDAGRFTRWTAQSNVLGDLYTVAILTDRASSPTNLNDVPKTQADEKSLKDIRRDWHLHSDMDNRYMIRRTDYPALRAYYDPTGQFLKEGEYLWLDEESIVGNVDLTKGQPNRNIMVDEDHIWKSDSDYGAIDISTGSYTGIITPQMLVRIGGTGETDTSYRNEDNVNGLFITFLRTPINKNEPPKPNDPLFVIFETKRSDRTTPVGKNIVYKKSDPSAIVLGNIKETLKDYMIKYGPMVEMINTIAESDPEKKVVVNKNDFPDMDDLKIITNIVSNVEAPHVIYFNNSIIPQQDITLSMFAKEHNYYKSTGGDYVWRYSGKIKPAIYPLVIPSSGRKRVERFGNRLRYNSWYGRNFLWYKEPIFTQGQSTPTNLARYINKNIPPKYPSLDFDTVLPMANDGVSYKNIHGDLLYDEIPPMYLGKTLAVDPNGLGELKDRMDFTPIDFGFEDINSNGHSFSFSTSVLGKPINSTNDSWLTPEYEALAREAVKENKFDLSNLINRTNNFIGYWLYADQYSSYEWAEYKWFDSSYIVPLPTEYSTMITPTVNTKECLENELLNRLLRSIRAGSRVPKLYDKSLLKSIYDFDYDLQKIDPQGNCTLLEYKYMVKATLK